MYREEGEYKRGARTVNYSKRGEISPLDKLCILGYGLLQLIISIKWKEKK